MQQQSRTVRAVHQAPKQDAVQRHLPLVGRLIDLGRVLVHVWTFGVPA